MRICNCAVSTLVLVLAAAPAWAQEAKSVDVTPYVGIGSVAASPAGVAVTVPITSTLGIETDVAYRRGEGDIHALSTSASLQWSLPRIGQATPYLAAGVGLSQFGAPAVSADGSWIATKPGVALAANIGGGLKMPVNERISLRTDARWFTSFGAHGSEQYRVSQGMSFKVGKR